VHRRPDQVIVTIVLIGLALTALVALVSVGTKGASAEVSPALSESPNVDQDAVGLEIHVQDIDPALAQSALLLIPRAYGNTGENLPNGAYFSRRVALNLDVAQGPSAVDAYPTSILGGINVGVSMTGNDASYPFDDYQMRLFVAATTSESDGDDETSLWLMDPASPTEGFATSAQQVSFTDGSVTAEAVAADRSSGYGLVEWQIQRSWTTKVMAMLLCSLIAIGALVSLAITVAVVRGWRPPSIGVMAWLAAFLFALFQIRSQLPGSPATGINIDRFLVFPAILLLVVLVAVNVISWSVRDDWDAQNPVFAVRGKYLWAKGKDVVSSEGHPHVQPQDDPPASSRGGEE
jgi:hypothetical protein